MSQPQEKHEGLIPVRTMMGLPLAPPSASTDTPGTVNPRKGSGGRTRLTAPADLAGAVPQHVADEELVQLAQPTADGRASSSAILVDLTAILLKPGVASPAAAVTASVDRDDTTTWLIADDDGQFRAAAAPSADIEISLLIRTPVTREPAWQTLLRDRLGLAEEFPGWSTSSGAILFVRTPNAGAGQLVAWCFGQGSRWIRRAAASPRFGLLAALNALAGAMASNQLNSVGVVGAALAARDGNLRRANLTAAVPTTADAIPRIDTLADVLMAARIRTGHDVLGSVSAGRTLQFADLVSSVTDFRRLSALVVELAGQDRYREAHGWIDYIVPETDEAVVEAVLERIWRGADDDGERIDVEIAWWEDLRETGSDHPVTHWLLGGERRRKFPVRNLALTWPAVRAQLAGRLGALPGAQAFGTEIRFFSDDEQELGRCPVAELLSAELGVDGKTYVLNDGEVCRVDAEFLAALDRDLQSRVVASVLLAYRPGEREDAYNARAAAAAGMLLLDKEDIRPSGMTQVEPCDLLAPDGGLYHVKRHTSAPGISHVVTQAVTSGTLLLRKPESLDKLLDLIDNGAWGQAEKDSAKAALRQMRGSASRVPVTLAIVGEWTNPTIKSVSLLCRLALRTAVQRLGDLGYPTNIMLIEREGAPARR